MAGIFISYRRDDTAGYAGRLTSACPAASGRKLVFIDVDDIPPGRDFVNALDQTLCVM